MTTNYYQKHKKKPRKGANLSEKEKDKKAKFRKINLEREILLKEKKKKDAIRIFLRNKQRN